jgi:hypothetical protein
MKTKQHSPTDWQSRIERLLWLAIAGLGLIVLCMVAAWFIVPSPAGNALATNTRPAPARTETVILAGQAEVTPSAAAAQEPQPQPTSIPTIALTPIFTKTTPLLNRPDEEPAASKILYLAWPSRNASRQV